MPNDVILPSRTANAVFRHELVMNGSASSSMRTWLSMWASGWGRESEVLCSLLDLAREVAQRLASASISERHSVYLSFTLEPVVDVVMKSPWYQNSQQAK